MELCVDTAEQQRRRGSFASIPRFFYSVRIRTHTRKDVSAAMMQISVHRRSRLHAQRWSLADCCAARCLLCYPLLLSLQPRDQAATRSNAAQLSDSIVHRRVDARLDALVLTPAEWSRLLDVVRTHACTFASAVLECEGHSGPQRLLVIVKLMVLMLYCYCHLLAMHR